MTKTLKHFEVGDLIGFIGDSGCSSLFGVVLRKFKTRNLEDRMDVLFYTPHTPRSKIFISHDHPVKQNFVAGFQILQAVENKT